MKNTSLGQVSKSRGLGLVGALILILLAGALFYIGHQVVTIYYSYYDLIGMMDAQAQRAEVRSDGEIREFLAKRIVELQIPVDNPAEALKINRFNSKIVIQMQYVEVVYIDFGGDNVYDLWEFQFRPLVERPL